MALSLLRFLLDDPACTPGQILATSLPTSLTGCGGGQLVLGGQLTILQLREALKMGPYRGSVSLLPSSPFQNQSLLALYHVVLVGVYIAVVLWKGNLVDC